MSHSCHPAEQTVWRIFEAAQSMGTASRKSRVSVDNLWAQSFFISPVMVHVPSSLLTQCTISYGQISRVQL